MFEVAGSLEVKHEVITYFISSLLRKLQLNQTNGSMILHHLVCIKKFQLNLTRGVTNLHYLVIEAIMTFDFRPIYKISAQSD